MRWTDRIMKLRKAELAEQFKFLTIEAVAELIWEILPIFVACISLAWFTLVSGHALTVATAFPAILALSQLTGIVNNVTFLTDWRPVSCITPLTLSYSGLNS